VSELLELIEQTKDGARVSPGDRSRHARKVTPLFRGMARFSALLILGAQGVRETSMKRIALTLSCAVCALVGCASGDAVTVSAPEDTVEGRSITAWTEAWWRWTFAVPADKNPELVLEADCGAMQGDAVFFIPAYDGDQRYQRSCRVPAGKPALVPLWVIINDYPCPDPSFTPAPGQPLEDFLRQGAVDYNNQVTGLTVTLDGEKIDHGAHRHTTGQFEFTADKSLVGKMPDPCLGGTAQPGISDGFWLMLSLSDGEHVVHVTGQGPDKTAFDYTYKLSVVP
jgi:hypothetical protein